MKNNPLLLAIVLVFLILSSAVNSAAGQTQKGIHRQQDTTKMKDRMNRMNDSTRLKHMMRDSNLMKNHPRTNDSMPTKKGWMNNDSSRKKSRRTI